MLDKPELARWREAAEDALQASRDNAKSGWHNWSCMIAEQAVQLGVKAVLHGAGRGDRARGHDLVQLLDTAVAVAGLSLSEPVRDAAVRLSRHYHPTRYPDALPGGTPRGRYTPTDAQEAIADAATVLRAVDESIAALRAAEGQEASNDEPS
jgi:HEPN domain-containing protein